MFWIILFLVSVYYITCWCLKGIVNDVKEIIKYLKNK